LVIDYGWDDKITVHHLMQEESDFSSNEEEKIDAYSLLHLVESA
jgi:hypothetical protein